MQEIDVYFMYCIYLLFREREVIILQYNDNLLYSGN